MNPITLIAVTHNSSHILEEFLSTIEHGREPDDQIILVDSGSADIAAVRTIARQHDALLLESERNVGYGAGSNLGAAQARNDWLAIVNPDVGVTFVDLHRLADEASALGAQCLGPQITDADGREVKVVRDAIRPPWRSGRVAPVVRGTTTIVESLSGSCMVLQASWFRKLGGFDEYFFMFCEETDLHTRIRAAQGTVAVTTLVTVHTPGGGSSSTASRRWAVTERSVGHVRYVYKHFTLWEAAVDAIWRYVEILAGGEFAPRRISIRQFTSGVFASAQRKAAGPNCGNSQAT